MSSIFKIFMSFGLFFLNPTDTKCFQLQITLYVYAQKGMSNRFNSDFLQLGKHFERFSFDIIGVVLEITF